MRDGVKHERSKLYPMLVACLCLALFVLDAGVLFAAKLTVDLGDAKGIAWVGAVDRWDPAGKPRRPVNPKAKIEAPYVDAKAKDAGHGQWVFDDLKPGRYDLLIFAEGRVRIEGFTFAPVNEHDPFLKIEKQPDAETAKWISDDIRQGRYFENKIETLYQAGDDKAVRLLMLMIRDKRTTYTPGAGTIRHEIWQYSANYAGWQKERNTQVLDRTILQVDQLRQWTWLRDPKLGGIEVAGTPVKIEYRLPKKGEKTLKGLYPY